jgi:hypothetical protein
MDNDRVTHAFEQRPVAPIIRICRGLVHENSTPIGPTCCPVKLSFTIARGTIARAVQVSILDDGRGGE